MATLESTSLLQTARHYWPWFVLGWTVPLILLWGSAAIGWGFMQFLFFAGFFLPAPLWMTGKIRYWHLVFWGILVPFLIWIAAVIFNLAVLRGNG